MPDRVKSIVSTAKPMAMTNGPPYAEFEVGAGYVDTFAAGERLALAELVAAV